MRLQAFAVGQGRGDFTKGLGAGSGDVDQAGALLEVVDTQRRGEPGRARGGQDVVRTGAVVAEGWKPASRIAMW